MRHIATTILFSILCGFCGMLVLGVMLGDSDDHFWWHALVFAVPALCCHSLLKKIQLPALWKYVGYTIFGFIALCMIVFSLYGIVTSRSLLDGHEYDGMAGLVPYLAGLLSLIPLLIIGLLALVRTKTVIEEK